MDIKNVDLASLGLAPSSGPAGPVDKEDTFLTLMLAQLQNQDPFQPMEGGEFLTQLAQFEMVAGVNAMQQGLEALAGSMLSNQVLESAALVGKTVFAELSEAGLEDGGTIEGAVDVPAGAASVAVEVRNGAGELVRRIALPPGAGRQSFVWDGLDATGQAVPAGNYRFSAQADVDGSGVAATVLLADQVRSVTLGGQGQQPTLNLAGGGQLSFSEILEIR